MIGSELYKAYSYEGDHKMSLPVSGSEVTSPKVFIKDAKVIRINEGRVVLPNKDVFTFNVYPTNSGPGGDDIGDGSGKTKWSQSGCPEDVDAQEIIKEFVDSVLADTVVDSQ